MSQLVITSYSIHYTKLYEVNTMTFKYKPSSDNLALDVDVLDAIIAIGKSNRMCRSTFVITSYSIHYTKLYE